jgi:hypothetical protein
MERVRSARHVRSAKVGRIVGRSHPGNRISFALRGERGNLSAWYRFNWNDELRGIPFSVLGFMGEFCMTQKGYRWAEN